MKVTTGVCRGAIPVGLIACAAMFAQNREIVGYADVHMHMFANLAFGGKGFVGKPFGPIATALPHCDFEASVPPIVHGPVGVNDLLLGFLRQVGNFGLSALTHPVGGYPEFDGWPKWNSPTHQTVYQEWLKRAHSEGLQLIVMLAVNNEAACEGWPWPVVPGVPWVLGVQKAIGRTCDDMEAVDLQIDATYEMEKYIADNDGGWLQVVKSPAQARAAIAAGKLAVVLGVEVDGLFNCHAEPAHTHLRELGLPLVTTACTPDSAARDLQKYYDRGLRHFFPIHFTSNRIGGAALTNQLTTAAHVRDCSDRGYKYQHPLYSLAGSATCNADGLTDLGKTLIEQMVRKKLIIDVDHMSARSFADTMDIVEDLGYPVISGHTGFIDISSGNKLHEGNHTLAEVRRIRNVGGLIAPILQQGDSSEVIPFLGAPWTAPAGCSHSIETFAQAYLYSVTQMNFGPVPFGSDFNAPPPPGTLGPQFGSEACSGGGSSPPDNQRLQYPFLSTFSGNSVRKSVIGQKEFDFNTEGIAHIGMLPDFIEQLKHTIRFRYSDNFRDAFAPLFRSAEGYISMWERAEQTRVPVYTDASFSCTACGDGTRDNPYNDLFRAIDNAQSGTTVFLRPGTYKWPPAGTLGKTLRFRTWGVPGIIRFVGGD